MMNHNAANERIKRQYFAYLREALGHSEQSIDAAAKAISRFETYTRQKDFKAFHVEQAKAFKRDLADQRGYRSGEPLSKATLYATLIALKRFFTWLAGQPGYKSRISYSDAEYSIFQRRRRESLRRPVLRVFPRWSRFGTSSNPCRGLPTSNAETALWSPS
jgi:hypothetical protein